MSKYSFTNTPKSRSDTMKKIRSKNTKPELALRKALWGKGIRGYRLHRSDIPGTPDIAFVAKKVAVFVDGSFWHGHNWETRKQDIKTNRGYWLPKIERNMLKDEAVTYTLEYKGWRILRFWDFDIKNNLDAVVKKIETALYGKEAWET